MRLPQLRSARPAQLQQGHGVSLLVAQPQQAHGANQPSQTHGGGLQQQQQLQALVRHLQGRHPLRYRILRVS
jgi:hypothetical protein